MLALLFRPEHDTSAFFGVLDGVGDEVCEYLKQTVGAQARLQWKRRLQPDQHTVEGARESADLVVRPAQPDAAREIAGCLDRGDLCRDRRQRTQAAPDYDDPEQEGECEAERTRERD